MSRIAKHPIKLPAGVEAKIAGRKVLIKGKKGELNLDVSNDIKAEMKEGAIVLSKANDSKTAKMMWGISIK